MLSYKYSVNQMVLQSKGRIEPSTHALWPKRLITYSSILQQARCEVSVRSLAASSARKYWRAFCPIFPLTPFPLLFLFFLMSKLSASCSSACPDTKG